MDLLLHLHPHPHCHRHHCCSCHSDEQTQEVTTFTRTVTVTSANFSSNVRLPAHMHLCPNHTSLTPRRHKLSLIASERRRSASLVFSLASSSLIPSLSSREISLVLHFSPCLFHLLLIYAYDLGLQVYLSHLADIRTWNISSGPRLVHDYKDRACSWIDSIRHRYLQRSGGRGFHVE